MVALQALGVPEDSPLKNLNQIPFLGSPTATQNCPNAIDEEETQSMRELVEVIDSHVEAIDLEATSNLQTDNQPGEGVQLQPSSMIQQLIEIIQMQPADPTS